MKNTGIEFEVNVDIFNQPDLKWTVSLVGSHYKNRIVTLPEETVKWHHFRSVQPARR